MDNVAKPNIEQVMAFAVIGNLVVCAGGLERTMQRLVEWLHGSEQPETITITFARKLSGMTLLERLRKEAKASPLQTEIARILDDHRAEACMRVRHSLVHGDVNVSQSPSLMINRTMISGPEGDSLQLTTTQLLLTYIPDLVAMTVQLDALLPEEHRRVKPNLAAGVVGITREQAVQMGLDPDRPFEEQRPRRDT